MPRGGRALPKTVIPTGRKANGHAEGRHGLAQNGHSNGAQSKRSCRGSRDLPKQSFRAVAIGEESLHAKTLCLRSVRFRASRFPRFRSLTPPRAFPASPSLGLTSGRHAPAASLLPGFPQGTCFCRKGQKGYLPAKAPKNASESLGRIHRGIFTRCRKRENGRSARAPFSCPCAARPCVPYHPCSRPPTYSRPCPWARASVHAAPCAPRACPHVRPSPKTPYVNFTLAIFLPPKGGGTRRIGPEGLLTGQKGRGMFGP